MPRLGDASAIGVVLVLVLSVGAGLFGRESLPRIDETPQQYALRLYAVGSVASKDMYTQALLLSQRGAILADSVVPGVSQYLGLMPSVGSGGTERDSTADPAKAPSVSQDTLKQTVARNEDEINDQQAVSTQRYLEAQVGAEDDTVIFPEQPDEIRTRMPEVDPDGPEMRCSSEIGPKSTVTTRNIELATKTEFMRKGSWKYVVTFTNHGKETVQMLTRHWVFVNSQGVLENEVKGPGARGVTPVLPPGGQWVYESGTSLATPYGTMHGSFQFEVLKGDKSEGKRSFSARVGRLLLAQNSKGTPRKVPCPAAADAALLPGTSVMVTERVIAGGRADFQKKKKEKYHFHYDVQINNARGEEVEVVGHMWEVIDSTGKRHVVAEGLGVGGSYRTQKKKLPAGDAFRVQGELVSPTPEANAQCTYRLLVKGENGLPMEIEAGTDLMGLATTQGEEVRVPNFLLGAGLS